MQYSNNIDTNRLTSLPRYSLQEARACQKILSSISLHPTLQFAYTPSYVPGTNLVPLTSFMNSHVSAVDPQDTNSRTALPPSRSQSQGTMPLDLSAILCAHVISALYLVWRYLLC